MFDPETGAITVEALAESSIDELVQQYLSVRDALDSERKRYQEFEITSKDIMARISMAMKTKADQLGVTSFATPHGTAYRNVKESYRVSNWDEVIRFIRQTDNFQMLERRVAKNATKEIHTALGEIPPGVEYVAEVEFLVRRASKKLD